MATELPAMQYRFLGKTGLKVSVISLGSWLTYGGHVEDGNYHCLSPIPIPNRLFEDDTNYEKWVDRTYECLKVAYDVGVNFFDTAEGYEGGKSEIILGKAIKRFGWKQQDLVISTKVSNAPP
jgi:aryl-alcohol dehydrogenase-like predicted oxidoreductase